MGVTAALGLAGGVTAALRLAGGVTAASATAAAIDRFWDAWTISIILSCDMGVFLVFADFLLVARFFFFLLVAGFFLFLLPCFFFGFFLLLSSAVVASFFFCTFCPVFVAKCIEHLDLFVPAVEAVRLGIV